MQAPGEYLLIETIARTALRPETRTIGIVVKQSPMNYLYLNQIPLPFEALLLREVRSKTTATPEAPA